jgi:lipopolysaccharide assembly outer membrane protein LptD (OstA)
MTRPGTKRSATLRLEHDCARILAAALLAAATVSPAFAECPPATTPSAVGELSDGDATDSLEQDIELEMDSMEASKNGEWLLKGEVSVTQGRRRLKTRDATYDPGSQRFSTDNGVEYVDPDLTVRGEGARIDPDGGASFTGEQFE